MNKFLNPRSAVLAFVFVGFSGIGISSFAGQASASILDECRASTKAKVIACCKQHIARFGRPIWMSNGEDSNCKAVAVCVGKRSGRGGLAVAAFVNPVLPCTLRPPILNDREGRKLSTPSSNRPPTIN